MSASLFRSLSGVASQPRGNQTTHTPKNAHHLSITVKRTTKTTHCSSLGDASFDFIESDNVDNDKTTKKPDLVPLVPDAPQLPSNGPRDLHADYFDEDGNFGPLSLLAVGLDEAALSSVARLLEQDLEARGVVPSFVASSRMLQHDLRSAFEKAADYEEELCLFRNAEGASSSPSKVAPRSSVERPAIVLSGMSSAEVLSVVRAWKESGCAIKHAEVLFCAAVPGNWTGRTLLELIEDISGDAASVGA